MSGLRKKIYEAPLECWAGFALAASAPRLIFDFHLIFFPAFNSVSGEANKGMRMGDAEAGTGSPHIKLEPPERPKARAPVSVLGG